MPGLYLFSPCRHRGGAGGLGSPGSGCLTCAVLVEGAERAQRRQVIVNAARELAESEGWEAVTTRRLADRIEYSQPVLHSHFEGKDAIVSAVAWGWFGELAALLHDANKRARSLAAKQRAVANTYIKGSRFNCR
jgi:AcrR family transcriptional regulator